MTQIEEPPTTAENAQRKVEDQEAIVGRYENSINDLQIEQTAAQQRIARGEASSSDLDVIGLNPAKISAQQEVLAQARTKLGQLDHERVKLEARQWVEQTMEEYPADLYSMARDIKNEGLRKMEAAHRETVEQLKALDESRREIIGQAKTYSRAIERHPALDSQSVGLGLMHGLSITALDGRTLALDGQVFVDQFGAEVGKELDYQYPSGHASNKAWDDLGPIAERGNES